MGTWHVTSKAWKGHSCVQSWCPVLLVSWTQTHRDIPTAPTLTPRLTLAYHVSLSLCLPSEQGGHSGLCVLSLGEATWRKGTEKSPEGIPGQKTSWPGC